MFTASEDLTSPYRPRYYHRDGTPIIDNELFPASMQWALLFEQGADRVVGITITPYGERLSTVWLGMDHSFGGGRPLIFETMLFAPKQPCYSMAWMRRSMDQMRAWTSDSYEEWERENPTTEELKQEKETCERQEAYNKKHFPHNQLQLRYSSENEARDKHEELKMQCLVPPRWRHFIFWTIGRQETWRYYDDEDQD